MGVRIASEWKRGSAIWKKLDGLELELGLSFAVNVQVILVQLVLDEYAAGLRTLGVFFISKILDVPLGLEH